MLRGPGPEAVLTAARLFSRQPVGCTHCKNGHTLMGGDRGDTVCTFGCPEARGACRGVDAVDRAPVVNRTAWACSGCR